MKKIFTSLFFIVLFAFVFALDSNAQWVQQQTDGTFGTLYNVHAVDAQYVWASNGALVNTTDGGAHWVNLGFPQASGGALGLFFFDRDTGVVGKNWIGRTTNGGLTWDTVVNEYGVTDYGFVINDIFFLPGTPIAEDRHSYNLGWAVGRGRSAIVMTIDKGLTWRYLDIDRSIVTVQLYTVHFATPKVGWVGGGHFNGDGGLYKTTDSGYTWTRIPLQTEGAVSEVHAVDENVCFVAQDQGREVTSNGDTIWVGLVTKTTDGGKTWERVLSLRDNSFKGLYFVDSLYGWTTTCSFSFNTSSSIYRTTDGGKSWAWQDQIAFTRTFTGIHMIDRNTGWAVGNNRLIKKTTNGGGEGEPIAVRERNIERKNVSSISVYPHPVSGKATFRVELEQTDNVRLILSDVLGRTVKIIHEGMLSGGNHEFTVETSDLAAGVYECRFSTPQINTRRMVIVNK